MTAPDADPARVAVTVEQAWHRVPGGTATSVLQALAALAQRDDVAVVGVSARHRHLPPEAFRPPVPVRQLPLPRPLLYEAWHRLRWPAVQTATGPVDVVHATTFAIPPKRGPLVVTVHDLAFLADPQHFTRRGNRFFRRGLELTKREADLVVVPSTATLQECVAAGVDEDRLRLVPHGVRHLPVAEDRAGAVRRRLGLDRPYVLWCGTLEPRKNLPTLLTAFAAVARTRPELDLALVGPTGWGDAGLGSAPPERVRLVGFLDDPDLHAVYAGARAFCYPSIREGFGMPVLEAMSHGVPVVTSSGTPMEELVGEAGIAVPALDTDGVAEALLTATGPAHDDLARRARERAGRYSWERAADQLATVYREVAGR
ncbi:MAG: glycosyltransferase family 4 protein [Actinomycetes bacterium]